MVSNVLHIAPQQLAETLLRFRHEFAEDAEYQELRSIFPEEWPM